MELTAQLEREHHGHAQQHHAERHHAHDRPGQLLDGGQLVEEGMDAVPLQQVVLHEEHDPGDAG